MIPPWLDPLKKYGPGQVLCAGEVAPPPRGAPVSPGIEGEHGEPLVGQGADELDVRHDMRAGARHEDDRPPGLARAGLDLLGVQDRAVDGDGDRVLPGLEVLELAMRGDLQEKRLRDRGQGTPRPDTAFQLLAQGSVPGRHPRGTAFCGFWLTWRVCMALRRTTNLSAGVAEWGPELLRLVY
jgi:hypothetical protein